MSLERWIEPFRIMRHPFSGFDDLRVNKKASFGISVLILAVFALMEVLSVELIGSQFTIVDPSDVNLLITLLSSFLIMLIWTISNWCFCVLIDGKATFKSIWIISAYSLVPYMIAGYINVILGVVLTREEDIFRVCITIVGTIWSLIMIISAFISFHEFSFGKSITSIIITGIGMIVIAVLVFLIYSLFQQLLSNILVLVDEIILRTRLGG